MIRDEKNVFTRLLILSGGPWNVLSLLGSFPSASLLNKPVYVSICARSLLVLVKLLSKLELFNIAYRDGRGES